MRDADGGRERHRRFRGPRGHLTSSSTGKGLSGVRRPSIADERGQGGGTQGPGQMDGRQGPRGSQPDREGSGSGRQTELAKLALALPRSQEKTGAVAVLGNAQG